MTASSSRLLLLLLVVLSLRASLTGSQDAACPATDARCTCIMDFFSQRIVCERLDYVDELPPFNRSSTEFESLTVRQSTVVRRVQAAAFRGLRLGRVDLQSLCIETIDADAFAGIDSTRLREVHLADNFVEDVAVGTFRNLSSLTVLALQHNAIRRLDPALFRALAGLRYLHLDGNRIAALPEGLLGDLAALRELYLANNELVEISATALRGPSALRKLELNGNRLRRVAAGAFSWLGELRELRLHDNLLGPVVESATFDGLSRLEIVDVSNCFVARLPADAFARTPRLTSVYVANNQLRSFERPTFASLSRLATLSVAGNRLSRLPDGWLDNSTSVTTLHLQQNRLRDVGERTFAGLASLRSLFLSHNRLRRLDAASFGDLTALSSLDLNENLVEYLAPGLLRHNAQLSSLHLRRNRLRAVPEGVFRDLPRLRYIYLADNLIASLDSGAFGNLSLLIYLEVSRNRIATISDGALVDLPNLFSFLLDGNDIRSISTSVLSGLSNLRTIYLNDNSLTTIANGTFRELGRLQRLFLPNNRIASVEPGTFSNLEMLQTLDLSSNNISQLSAHLFAHGPARLRLLNLSYNSLENLHDDRFRGLRRLTSLDLSSNLLTTARNTNFTGLTRLQTLRLNRNRLSSVDNMTFISNFLQLLSELSLSSNLLSSSSLVHIRGLPSLSTLALDNNLIDDLPAGAFSQCPLLSSLSLRSNQIASLDAGAWNSLPTLKYLDLGYNSLDSADLEDLGSLFPQLETLKLDGNRLLSLPRSIFQSGGGGGRSTPLVEVDLSSNRLRSHDVFACLSNLTTVSVLTLDRNLLDVVPAGLTAALSGSVTTLSMRSNRLTSDGVDALRDFTRLTQLRLDVNRLRRLPTGIFARMFGLQTLTASDNQLRQLHGDAFSASARTLTALSLADNHIQTVDALTFARMTAIRDLDLSDNQIAQLTLPSIMGQLNRLSLSRNDLTTFPAGLRWLPLIRTLDLSANRVTRLPEVVVQNYAVTMSVNLADNMLRDVDAMRLVGVADRVDFGGNQLRQISPSSPLMVALRAVDDVDFSRNMFSTVPAAAFDSLDRIRNDLTFYSNFITDLDAWRLDADVESTVRSLVLRRNVIVELPRNVTTSLRLSLVHLDLRDNLLVTLDQSEFEAMEALEQLDVRFNHLECDCRLAWLRRLAEQQVRVDMATCAGPRGLIGESVLCYNVTGCDDVDDDVKSIVADRCVALSSSPPGVRTVALPVYVVAAVVLQLDVFHRTVLVFRR